MCLYICVSPPPRAAAQQPAKQIVKAMIRLHITPVSIACTIHMCSPPKSNTISLAAINSSYLKGKQNQEEKKVYQEWDYVSIWSYCKY